MVESKQLLWSIPLEGEHVRVVGVIVRVVPMQAIVVVTVDVAQVIFTAVVLIFLIFVPILQALVVMKVGWVGMRKSRH